MTALPLTLDRVPVYAVNLEHRTDRWDALTRNLADVGLPAPIRWPAIDGVATTTPRELRNYKRGAHRAPRTVAACIGNNKSFTGLVRHILDQGYPWALILEDDAEFHPHTRTLYRRFAEQVPDDVHKVMLGALHKATPTPTDPTRLCWRVKRAQYATAFMINPESGRLLLEANTPRRTSFDVMWTAVHDLGRTYAPNPHLAIQRGDYSDIGHRVSARSSYQYAPEHIRDHATWIAHTPETGRT